jgi:hypothetical protein
MNTTIATWLVAVYDENQEIHPGADAERRFSARFMAPPLTGHPLGALSEFSRAIAVPINWRISYGSEVPMSQPLKRIRLNLARSKEFPSGSTQHGYEFVAPLDQEGHIDPAQWRKYRDQCHVRRFWSGSNDEMGRLVHKPGGAEHASWAFHYNPAEDEDDETGYRLGAHVFAPGEYVSIRDHDNDELHTFRVASVEPVA